MFIYLIIYLKCLSVGDCRETTQEKIHKNHYRIILGICIVFSQKILNIFLNIVLLFFSFSCFFNNRMWMPPKRSKKYGFCGW